MVDNTKVAMHKHNTVIQRLFFVLVHAAGVVADRGRNISLKEKKMKKKRSFSWWQLLINFITGGFFGPIFLTVVFMPMHLDDLILTISSIVGAFAFGGFYWLIYKDRP